MVVQVVAVGDHDDGRVGHLRLANQGTGQHQHGKGLARSLRVPDHPSASVALARRWLKMIENAGSHLSHSAELVVPRDLLGDLAAFVLLEEDAGL